MIPTIGRVNTSRDNLEDFKWYCENFLSVVVGKHEFGNNKKKKLVSKIATKSDEALVLLYLENSIGKWTSQYNDPEGKSKSDWTQTGYTLENSQAKKYKGWSKEGIERFRFLMSDHVPKIRKSSEGVEEALMEMYNARGGRKNAGDDDTGSTEVISLLESEDEGE